MNKFSNYYQETNKKFLQAEKDFDKKPCKKTAKTLSDLRVKINNMPRDQKYTPEYLTIRDQEIKEAQRKNASYMRNLFTTVSIEHAYKQGHISNSMRNAHHEINDIANPIEK